MKLNSITDAEIALRAYIPLAHELKGRYDLTRMQAFLASVGNPQASLRVVHIAGTSGKTSTSYFMRALLTAAGQKTGLTVSPHITSLTERLQLNKKPVTDELFLRELGKFLDIVAANTVALTYFEVLIAFAYWFFAKQQVDYAVIETGLGGLLDCTNTITRSDKISLISDIGYDHTTILGKTIQEIARQKAGIIVPGSTAFVIEQDSEVLAVIEDQAKRQHAKLTIVPPATSHHELPLFQRRNWALAEAAYRHLQQRDHLPSLAADQLATARLFQPPGRMEKLAVGNKLVILDGAHNPQKFEALRRALNAQGITQTAVLANFVKAPEFKLRAYFEQLRPLASLLIVPEFIPSHDFIRHSMPATYVATQALAAGLHSVIPAKTVEEGLKAPLQRPESVVVVTGSLFLIGVVRKILRSE